MSRHGAVFLDRDGTLTRTLLRHGKPVAPSAVADFELLPGVAEAVQRLHAAGYRLVVVTNQPDVRTGATTREAVAEMNRLLCGWLPLDDVRVCEHIDADHCECRKPKPGLLLAAARAGSIDLARSWMIGDRWRDVGAGKAAGCRTILVQQAYAERAAEAPDFTVKTFAEAAEIVLKSRASV